MPFPAMLATRLRLERIKFVLVILNDGDVLIENLNVHVDVIANADGANPIRIAGTDEASGGDEAIGLTQFGAAYDNLSAGDYLANGAYTVREGSSTQDVVWTPSNTGNYESVYSRRFHCTRY